MSTRFYTDLIASFVIVLAAIRRRLLSIELEPTGCRAVGKLLPSWKFRRNMNLPDWTLTIIRLWKVFGLKDRDLHVIVPRLNEAK